MSTSVPVGHTTPRERRVALTGGASGIGAGAAVALARAGWQVVVTDVDLPGAQAVAEQVGGRAAALDVTDAAAVQEFFATVGPLDALVCSVGGAPRVAALEVDEDTWARTFDLNVAGFFRCARAAVAAAAGAGRGLSVVHVGSSLAQGSAPDLAHFGAAKAACASLVRTLAVEWAPLGVRVNAVVPGLTRTAATEAVLAGAEDALAASIPLGRVGEPADVAAAVTFLVDDTAGWVTGSSVVVDGGWAVRA